MQVRHYLNDLDDPSPERQSLIGAYFTHEYSPESAALFNPSIVPHPDQSGLPEGALRFILSLRATGEGHISSITFRIRRGQSAQPHHPHAAGAIRDRAGARAQCRLTKSPVRPQTSGGGRAE